MISRLAALMLLAALPAWADDLSPICPDRPGKGTSPCTVEAEHAQVEIGLYDVSTQRRSGTTTDLTLAGNTLAKYGIGDSLDLEAGMALYQALRIHDATGTMTQSGVGDLFLHAKWNTGASGFAFVLDPYIKLPTAGALGNGHVEAGLVAPLSLDLGDGWSLADTPEADLQLNASGSGYHANFADVIGIGRGFGPLSLGAELWGDQNLDPLGGTCLYSFDLNAAYLANNDLQLDAGMNLGLNRATPDAEFYFGISRRF